MVKYRLGTERILEKYFRDAETQKKNQESACLLVCSDEQVIDDGSC